MKQNIKNCMFNSVRHGPLRKERRHCQKWLEPRKNLGILAQARDDVPIVVQKRMVERGVVAKPVFPPGGSKTGYQF